MFKLFFVPLLLACFVVFVHSHGGLTTPAPRLATGYEEGPTAGASSAEFVCRHENAGQTADVTLVAGSTVDLTWNFGAAHVGDCALFLSYDVDASIAREDMEFFKIANFPDCNVDNVTPVTVNVPDWLPAGQAVLRWDWYALHVYPTVEFYVQCIDVVVESSSTVEVSDITTYVINGIYPTSGDQAAGKFWDPYTNTVWKMEGPPCAADITGNCCDVEGYDRSGYDYCATTGESAGDYEVNTDNTADDDDVETYECTTHVVETGDTLASIADMYDDVTWEELCAFNGIVDCNVIDVGEVLIIPDTCIVNADSIDAGTVPRADMWSLLAIVTFLVVLTR